jgi:hypothetical protein
MTATEHVLAAASTPTPTLTGSPCHHHLKGHTPMHQIPTTAIGRLVTLHVAAGGGVRRVHGVLAGAEGRLWTLEQPSGRRQYDRGDVQRVYIHEPPR